MALLLNNELLTKSHWATTQLIHGKANILHLSWDEDNHLDIINVHVPNPMQEKIEFWTQMTETLQQRVKREHTILLGDFNFIESALDRLPQHMDDNRLIQTFEHVTHSLQMVNGWQLDNPNQIDFTFSQTHATGNSLARID